MTPLRSRAEQVLASQPLTIPAEQDLLRLYHELQVHQAELEIQNDELKRAQEEVEAMQLEKTSLYRALTHDLSHPLLAIRLFLQAFSAQPLDATQRNLVDRMSLSASGLEELARALTELSREGGPGKPEAYQTTALAPVLERALNDHLPGAEGKGVALRLLTTSAEVVTVPSVLCRIVSNMLANALRQMAAGSLLLGVRRVGRTALRIEIWTSAAVDDAADADGAAAAQLPDETLLLQAEELNPANGEGLGLSIAYRLAQGLGLSVGVQSVTGRGRVFTLTLPSRSPAHRTL